MVLTASQQDLTSGWSFLQKPHLFLCEDQAGGLHKRIWLRTQKHVSILATGIPTLQRERPTGFTSYLSQNHWVQA